MNNELMKIKSSLNNLKPFLIDNYSVNTIQIFGSFVRHEQNANSDLDILVTFIETPSLVKFLSLQNFLSDKLNLKVDLVMKNSLKPRISKNILQEAISL